MPSSRSRGLSVSVQLGVLFFVTVLLVEPVLAQSIRTIAGGGPLRDGGPARNAVLSRPNDVAFGPDGALYIADQLNHRVRRVDMETGLITTYAGGGSSGHGDGGPATEAEILSPIEIAFDPHGNLYIGTLFNHVRRVDAKTGIISTFAGHCCPEGHGTPEVEYELNISDIEFDPDGKMLVASLFFGEVVSIDPALGTVTRIAGRGGHQTSPFQGDGGPALEAVIEPESVTVDRDGNYVISANQRILRIDRGTGLINVVAGGGEGEDGGPALGAFIGNPVDVTVIEDGSIVLSDWPLFVRRVRPDGIIETIAGGGAFFGPSPEDVAPTDGFIWLPHGLVSGPDGLIYVAENGVNLVRSIEIGGDQFPIIAGTADVGDGGEARSAVLSSPSSLAIRSDGSMLIADTHNRLIRRFDPVTGVIDRFAGTGATVPFANRAHRLEFGVGEVGAVAIDRAGNTLFGSSGDLYRIDAETEMVSAVTNPHAEPGSGDGGPVSEAGIADATDIVIDGEGNLYLCDIAQNKIRRVDAATGVITTYAGTGEPYPQDPFEAPPVPPENIPATEAKLGHPGSIALDVDGNLYMADFHTWSVRKVDRETGLISNVVGGGKTPPEVGLDLAEVELVLPTFVSIDPEGFLWTGGGSVLVRVDLRTRRVDRVHARSPGSSGDFGPFNLARFNEVRAVRFDQNGDLFILDSGNNRVRAVFACVDPAPPILTAPPNGFEGTSTSPLLDWDPVDGAFFYDVYLDTWKADTLVASDLTTTEYVPQNLEPGTAYAWRVVAKGDPFCTPQRTRSSENHFFHTARACTPPEGFALVQPADGGQTSTAVTLAWNVSNDAGIYDIFFGTTNPPAFFRSTRDTSFAIENLTPGTTYFWQIVAHASCDLAKTTKSTIRRFTILGDCTPPGPFALLRPENGATNVPTSTRLEWSASADATSYDFYFGVTNPPPIFLPNVRGTRLDISGLSPGTTYHWRIDAKVACDPLATVSSPVVTFSTAGSCSIPGAPKIVFRPPGPVGVNESYVIAWSDAPDALPGATYLIERATDPGFTTITQTQETISNSVAFLADAPGIYHHRIRAANGCAPTVFGPESSTVTVEVIEQKANVIFTVEPEAVLTRLGQNLEDVKTRFTLENLSDEPKSVVLATSFFETTQFFRIVDPLGGDSTFVTLEPRSPKIFEIRFSGKPIDVPASYQGLVVVSAADTPVVPYAFVNLKVGDAGQVAPEIRIAGQPVEFVSFPPFGGSGDSSRAPLAIDIHNPGTVPMELGSEVGPDVWLEPEGGWNDQPLPPKGTRTVRLTTKRQRAPNGAPFPRYTYFKVRTKTGESARALVQDNEIAPVAPGRTKLLPSDTSRIIPHVVSRPSEVSKILMTNIGTEAIQLELVYTPRDAEGFGEQVKTASIVLPPNDVVTLIDPLRQVYGLPPSSEGQIEVRSAEGQLGLVRLQASVAERERVGNSLGIIPIVARQAGARSDLPHVVDPIVRDGSRRTDLVLVETSGIDGLQLELRLLDQQGDLLGSTSIELGAYEMRRIENVVSQLGVGSLTAGRLELIPLLGGGSVTGSAQVIDVATGSFIASASRPVSGSVSAKELWRLSAAKPDGNAETVTTALVMPYVVTGLVGGEQRRTIVGLVSPAQSSASFNLLFRGRNGTIVERTVEVGAGLVTEYTDILRELFGIEGTSEGSLHLAASVGATAYSRVVAGTAPAGLIPTIPTAGELVSSANGRNRPLYIDGLTQSTDPEKGPHWSLLINEIEGGTGSVRVRLYEAANRAYPIAERTLVVGANGQIVLDTVFSALGLDTSLRQKDRTNVLCVVVPVSGSAAITASAIETDPRTGRVEVHNLEPSGGSGGGVTTGLVKVIEPEPEEDSDRQRSVRRP